MLFSVSSLFRFWALGSDSCAGETRPSEALVLRTMQLTTPPHCSADTTEGVTKVISCVTVAAAAAVCFVVFHC